MLTTDDCGGPSTLPPHQRSGRNGTHTSSGRPAQLTLAEAGLPEPEDGRPLDGRLAGMAMAHSSEAFYALDDPPEAALVALTVAGAFGLGGRLAGSEIQKRRVRRAGFEPANLFRNGS